MIRKIDGRVGNSVRIPVVVSIGCRAPGRVSEPATVTRKPTIAREHAWQPVPSPVVSPPPAGPTRQAAFAPQAARSPTATWSACTSTRSRVHRCSTPPRKSSCPRPSRRVCTPSRSSTARSTRRQGGRHPRGARSAGRRGRAGQGHLHPLQPPPGRRRRPALPAQWPAPARPDPGGQRRPGARGREVRLPQGLQVLDVRDLVDPSGHHPLDSRPVAHHPAPRPPGGGAGPDPPRAARVQPRARARPGARGDRRRAGLQRRSASSTCWTGPATRSA